MSGNGDHQSNLGMVTLDHFSPLLPHCLDLLASRRALSVSERLQRPRWGEIRAKRTGRMASAWASSAPKGGGSSSQ